jgi:hypothetical protein
MEEWLRDTPADKVIYCGDGGGDFEGAMRVPAGGAILARTKWSLHRRLAEAEAQGAGPRATVRGWETQAQLASLLLEELGLPATNLGH